MIISGRGWTVAVLQTKPSDPVRREVELPLPGGAADKAGNRFERRWTVLALLDMLDGKADSLRIEVPGKDGSGTEFRVTSDGFPVWHQVKRQRAQGPWTIASLAKEGVLAPWWAKIKAGGRCVFVSTTGAGELSELAERARDAASWTEFDKVFLDSAAQRERFERLRRSWSSPADDEVYIALNKVEVHTIDEPALRDLVEARLGRLVQRSASTAAAILEQLVEDSTHRLLTAPAVWNRLAAHGVVPTNLHGESANVRHQTVRGPAPRMAPPPDRKLVNRPELVNPLAGFLQSPPGEAIALCGTGGFGKTTLAAQVCRRPDVEVAFPGGTLWVTLGERLPDALIAAKINDLCELLDGRRPTFTDPALAGYRLGELLDDRNPTLLVLDDVWAASHLAPFLIGGRNCTRLATTRSTASISETAHIITVDRMSSEEGRELLTNNLARLSHERVERLLRLSGHWPLLLSLVNGAIRQATDEGDNPEIAAGQIADQLLQDGPDVLDIDSTDRRDRAVRATVESSLRLLSSPHRDRYLELAIFPEDVDVPIDIVELLWGTTGDMSPRQCRRLCRTLVDLSLLTGTSRIVRLHDVLRAYLTTALGTHRVARTNGLLVNRVCSGLAQPGQGVRNWDQAHPYSIKHLSRHAAAAGELDQLLIDPGFLLAASQPELLACMDAARSDEGRSAARVYERAAHHLRDEPAEERASYLELAARRAGATALAEATAASAPERGWTCTWANWRTETPHKILARHPDAIVQVACAVRSDGRAWMVSHGQDGSLRVVDLASNSALEPPWLLTAGSVLDVAAVAMPEIGPVVLKVDWYCGVRMWDLETETPLTIRLPQGLAVAKEVSWIQLTDGQMVAVIGYFDGTIRAWSLRTGRQLGETIAVFGDDDRHMWTLTGDVLADGRPIVITTSEVGPIIVWDLATGDTIGEPITGYTDRSMTLCTLRLPDGRPAVITESDDPGLRVWDLATGAQVGSPLVGAGPDIGAVTCARLSDGHDVIVAGAGDGSIHTWDLATRTPVGNPLSGHPSPISVMACVRMPDGRDLLITGGGDNTVRQWNLAASDRTTPASFPRVTSVGHVATVAVTAHHDGSLRAWDAASGRKLYEVRESTSLIWALACVETEPGRPLAVVGDHAGAITAWDLTAARTECLGSLSGDVLATACLRLPDGRTVAATGSTDSTVRTWDLTTGAELLRIDTLSKTTKPQLRGNWVTALTHTKLPNKRIALISGHGDGTIRVWDLLTGKPIGKPMLIREQRQPSPAEVRAIDCIRLIDGRTVAVAGSEDTTNATVVAWDLLTGEPLAVTGIRTGWVMGVVCTNLPSGPSVAITGDYTLRIWRIDTLRDAGRDSVLDWVPVREIDVGAPIGGLALGPESSVLIGTTDGIVNLRLDRLRID